MCRNCRYGYDGDCHCPPPLGLLIDGAFAGILVVFSAVAIIFAVGGAIETGEAKWLLAVLPAVGCLWFAKWIFRDLARRYP